MRALRHAIDALSYNLYFFHYMKCANILLLSEDLTVFQSLDVEGVHEQGYVYMFYAKKCHLCHWKEESKSKINDI